MNSLQGTVVSAEDALSHGDYEEAVAAATSLIEAGEPWLVDGLVRRAMALESWTEGPPDRLTSAALDWRKLLELGRTEVAHRALARILLKLGDRKNALQSLRDAERRGPTPEVLLGFAEYYRTCSPPDFERAKSYFFRAALKGRTQGMRGYAEAAMELNQPYAAWAMATFALAATPLLAMAVGARRHNGF